MGPSLVQNLEQLVAEVDLPDRDKVFLRSRWLDQVNWMEGRATAARDWYYRLRLATIVGGLLVPALISLNLNCRFSIVPWIATGLSLVVALSAAVEEFFHYGERWRHYRQTVETLKSEGWQFLLKTGPYRRFPSHAAAYPSFANHVEQLLRQDVGAYWARISPQRDEAEDRAPGPG